MNWNESKAVAFIAVSLAAILGGLIRFVIAQQDLLWLDEQHTAWVTSGAFSDVMSRAADGNQSPLFFWLVWPFVQLLGSTAFAVRIFSLVCGVALIFLTSWMVWKWTQSALASFVVAWLIAVDPQFVF